MTRGRHSLHTIYEEAHSTGKGYKWIDLKTGKRISFFDAENKAQTAVTMLARWVGRMFKLVGDHEYNQYDYEAIDRIIYRLETLIGFWREELNKRNVRKTKEERIRQLREVAGRFPEEAKSYLAKADELERGLDA